MVSRVPRPMPITALPTTETPAILSVNGSPCSRTYLKTGPAQSGVSAARSTRPPPATAAGFAIAVGHRLEAGPEIFRVEGAAPDGEGEPASRKRRQPDVERRLAETEVDEEDLNENRGVPDHLDIDRGELTQDGNAVRAGGP